MVYLLIMFQIRAYSEFDKIIVFLLWDISMSIDHWLVVNMESAEHLARLAELGQCSLNVLLLIVTDVLVLVLSGSFQGNVCSDLWAVWPGCPQPLH